MITLGWDAISFIITLMICIMIVAGGIGILFYIGYFVGKVTFK